MFDNPLFRIVAALAGAAALAQPAAAQTVVLRCSITSGDPGDVIEGGTELFKIGNGKWQFWDEKNWRWIGDFCSIGHDWIFASDAGSLISCTLNDYNFNFDGTRTRRMVKIHIDRRTGTVTTREWSAANRDLNLPTVDLRGTGTCELASDPALAPPPKTKF